MMSDNYRAYIYRDNREIEVTAQLLQHGFVDEQCWGDTGETTDVISEPEFHMFYAEDDNGNPISFTDVEMVNILGQLSTVYWNE